MKKTILHIPHASTHFPNLNGFVIDAITLKNEVEELTDHFTDDLFVTENSVPIIAPFSRVFCDVERFRSDEHEVMSKYGMGATYTHLENGNSMRELTPQEREQLLQNHYDIHHQKLTEAVDSQLVLNDEALIIDCHSFPDIPHQRNLNKEAVRPDICIGTDSFHTPEKLMKETVQFFESAGFSVAVNSPYAGTMVPLKQYGKDRRVKSIMVEVNRKLYLTGDFMKSKNYQTIKNTCQKFIEDIAF